MFLTAILSKCLGLKADTKISPLGHCHDMGDGLYVNTDSVNMLGWHWDKRTDCSIVNGHYTNLLQVKIDLPDHKIILIDVKDDDVALMTSLRFYKTMCPMSQREYDKFTEKFKITTWPEYKTLITSPKIVKDSITSYDATWFREWKQDIDTACIDYVVPFKTLHGLDSTSLVDLISTFGIHTNSAAQEFVEHYRTKNLTLYKEYE
jgi:hypothetical protein